MRVYHSHTGTKDTKYLHLTSTHCWSARAKLAIYWCCVSVCVCSHSVSHSQPIVGYIVWFGVCARCTLMTSVSSDRVNESDQACVYACAYNNNSWSGIFNARTSERVSERVSKWQRMEWRSKAEKRRKAVSERVRAHLLFSLQIHINHQPTNNNNNKMWTKFFRI